MSPSPPRIVSLLPAATDIAVALGAGGWLVGISHECDDRQLGAPVPRVTRSMIADGPPDRVDAAVRERAADGVSLYDLDADVIRSLRPDVVLTQALCDVCAVRESDVRVLTSSMAPSPRVVTLDATKFDEVLTDIGRVATAIDVADRGAALISALRDRLRAVHDRLHAALAPRPSVAVIEWPDPVFAAGHWVPDMVRRAGGRDVLADPGTHSATVTAIQVARSDPAVLIIAPCGYDASRAAVTAHALLGAPGWEWARTRTVWALNANTLTSRPGPHLVRGIEVLAAILHPALFAPPLPSEAINVAAGD